MSNNRIDRYMSEQELVMTLAGNNAGAITALAAWLKSDPLAVMQLLVFDTKRLYDHKIWEVYAYVCGQNLERFKYHVCVELPNQETGELSVTGPWHPSDFNPDFWSRRRFGKPGSYWALEYPPTDPNYEFPIG